MGIGDTKINKQSLGYLAKRTISNGNFKNFANNFSKYVSQYGLDKLANTINTRTNEEPVK